MLLDIYQSVELTAAYTMKAGCYKCAWVVHYKKNLSIRRALTRLY